MIFQIQGFQSPTGAPVSLSGYKTEDEATRAAQQLEGENFFIGDIDVREVRP